MTNFINLSLGRLHSFLITCKLTSGQQTRAFSEAVEQYAQLGLRTLCLAWRELKEDEYLDWSVMFREASSTLVDREVQDSYQKSCILLSEASINFGDQCI